MTGVPYRALWHQAGARACVTYLWQNHLFDVRRRVDTCGWLGRMEYPSALVDDEDSKIYMPVWTSSVRRSLRAAVAHSGWPSSFVDFGCGKGKALLVAHEEFRRRRRSVEVVGVEHHHGLAMIAERNLWKRTGSLDDVRVGDATLVSLDDVADPMIAFFYNPFTGQVLADVARQLKERACTVIYVNPVEPDAFTSQGFELVRRHDAWHPTATWMLFTSPGTRP